VTGPGWRYDIEMGYGRRSPFLIDHRNEEIQRELDRVICPACNSFIITVALGVLSTVAAYTAVECAADLDATRYMCTHIIENMEMPPEMGTMFYLGISIISGSFALSSGCFMASRMREAFFS
jgi:hypothetical protein